MIGIEKQNVKTANTSASVKHSVSLILKCNEPKEAKWEDTTAAPTHAQTAEIKNEITMRGSMFPMIFGFGNRASRFVAGSIVS